MYEIILWWLVPVGLLLDVLGALLMVVPDLNPERQDWIRRRTPWVRDDHKLAMELKSRGNNPTNLTELVRAAWPIPRKQVTMSDPKPHQEANLSTSEMDYILTEEIADSKLEDRNLALSLEGGEDFRLSTKNVYPPLEERIDQWYRSKGWILLAFGFALQLLGYFA